ncbi:MAG: mechanosensitive ion channel family protein [Nitrospirota bacterium]
MVFSGQQIIIPVVIVLASAAVLLIVRAILFRILHRWAARTETQFDDIVISSIKNPSLLLAVAISIHLGLTFSDIPEKHLGYLTRIIHLIIILAVTLASANLAGRLFKNYIQKSNLPIPTTGLAYGILKGAILVIGLLICLSVLGVSIAPLLTALGVGGLAVALALQDTLANLFAGIHILMEKSLRIGDFVKLETGQEGYIDDITWRTTRVRMLPNNVVVVPNSKLAQSVVTNYYLPEKRMSLMIPVGVSYSSDPEQVERILVEVAKKGALDIPGLLAEPEPVVRFIPGFGDSSLDFTLICQVKEFVDQYLAQHELRKRIFKRFNEEGIEIPFPHRTVYLREEKEWKK